jgi:alkylation response protein AidB-like acyl-CoA dehydrogenase
MDFRFSEDQERLREQVRQFLEQELPGWADGAPDGLAALVPGYLYFSEFERKMGARGWLGLSWPVEYGGGGLTPIDQLVVDEELAAYGAPGSENIGRTIVAPSILAFGNEEQKRRYLPGLARGETSFCLGYTESEAGSDLVSLQTRAVAQGDDFVINGRKLYTSGADRTTYCWLLVRTDPEAPQHRGLSAFVVPMDAPGVTVSPLTNLLNTDWFDEVLFEDVRVPRENLVGQENRGWYQVAAALDVERLALYPYLSHYRVFRALLRYAAQMADGTPGHRDRLRQKLAELAIEFQVARLLTYRAVWLRSQGGRRPDWEAAQVKLFNSEMAQRLYQVAVEVVGLHAQLRGDSARAVLSGVVVQGYLSTVQETIGAGTSEVQRNIIAGRGLGLPR